MDVSIVIKRVSRLSESLDAHNTTQADTTRKS
jgi:hypothetical protein